MKTVLHDRRGLWAFILGVIAVTGGVLLHIPMFMMGRHMGFRLHGMPMEADMYWGMAAIIVGTGIAAYGLLPRNVAQQRAAAEASLASGGPVQGSNFWAWNGEARARHGDYRYRNGDNAYMGDPMHEPQGWYGVFDSDAEMIAIMREHAQYFATA